ncbi:hypothetical protein GPECTOR_2g1106 [Gonium pectorale]|uniref:Cyclic nucleotide-binding domain-containing protein n=1 Tax=Gonium pectorale TaxID=33097 RepID=A0A150H063_GONPE|nr:hypothetical protein GPECTOR_2g1106 [Gonium pectorale]|eukprot:KXZ55557.1 hypothetical protein GPECTOR_2g1106 [Gonium pectorale]
MGVERPSVAAGRDRRRRPSVTERSASPASPSSPTGKLNKDWLYDRTDDAELPREELRDATEGAFTVLARFGASASSAPLSPLSRWRRSAIRIAANNAARRLREAARLKALQRTPYPLVLARIKLLLDRLAVFKEHISSMSGRLSPAHIGNRSRRRLATALLPPQLLPSSTFRRDASELGRSSGGGAPGTGTGDGGAVEEQAVESVIRNWDLRKAGGHLPSGPMDVLSRKPSKMIRESRSPGGASGDDDTDDDERGSNAGRGRRSRSASPARSMNGQTNFSSAIMAAAAAASLRVGGATGGGDDRTSMYDRSAYGDDLPLDYDSSLAMDDPSSGNKMSLDKLLEELSTTMSYVSDFLRKVPEETRMEACFAAKMENYKKDQTVYRIGDPPERFHLILTGVVEIWTHPPGNRREKTLIATLKKGQSFGEMAILNDEPRAEVATPTSNCTFLTFGRADLLSTFGPFFRERLLAAEQFFHSRVAVFQALPKSHTLRVISHMMQSTFPAGKDWEPQADQQIYFIKSGTASLEALDRRFAGNGPAAGGAGGAPAGPPPAATRATAAATVAAAMGAIPLLQGLQALSGGGPAAMDGEGEEGEEGGAPAAAPVNEVLAAISIVDGRAVGTLGHEDELRRLRRALIPKKVTAITEITLYHMHIDQFFKCASPELVRALRDDTAFKLTYYFGRMGTIGQDMVVGHSDASLATKGGPLQEEESTMAASRGASGAAGRKKKGGKKLGGHSTEVEKVISYMQELEAELDSPGFKNVDLYRNGTPAERYYRNPLLCGTARGNALPHLIAGVYGEGLAPLADKVESLAAKAARRLDVYHGDQPAAARMQSIMAPAYQPGGHRAGGLGSPSQSVLPLAPGGRAAPNRLLSPGSAPAARTASPPGAQSIAARAPAPPPERAR